jgi:hypothetical protein
MKTNKEISSSIPDNQEFWLELFKNNNIPVCMNNQLPTTKQGWIRLYNDYNNIFKNYYNGCIIKIIGFDRDQLKLIASMVGYPFIPKDFKTMTLMYRKQVKTHFVLWLTHPYNPQMFIINGDIFRDIINKSIEWCLDIYQ